MHRDFSFKEREKRSPEDLRRVLGKIYPEEMIDDIMQNLGFENEEKEVKANE